MITARGHEFDDAFLAIVYADAELVCAEFDDIIRTGWKPPPGQPAGSVS